ncbi:MAG: tail fiber domain-containing protein [Phycisphaerales bacterium]|nr:tail fiber domain-containing protein [Phycisphaerales bacterium]
MKKIASAVFTIMLTTSFAVAQSDTIFTYQGRLLDNGQPFSGFADFRFKAYDHPLTGNQISTVHTFLATNVADGLVKLGIDLGADVFNHPNPWLNIEVRAPSLSGTWETLLPRQQLTRAPFAIQTRGLQVDDQYHIGVGIAPQNTARFALESDELATLLARNIRGGVDSYAIHAQLTHPSPGAHAAAIRAEVTNTDTNNPLGSAIHASHAGLGVGVEAYSEYGWAVTGVTQFGYSGVLGLSEDEGGSLAGVMGVSQSVTGYGVIGTSENTVGKNYGVHGESKSAIGYGVYGIATHATGENYGVYGRTLSPDGYAVYGDATVQNGTTHGVVGRAVSPAGNGVLGVHDSDSGGGIGVWGITKSSVGIGVWGVASSENGTATAVLGVCESANGYDFYADGPGVNYGSPSSIRWKKNIEPINDPLGMLAQIRGVYFDWDEDHGGQHDMGFIGEEVMEVVPEVVAKEPGTDFVTGMDYGRMTPLLVEAVNALHAKHEMAIAEKDARIDLLARDNAELRARLEALEATVNQLAGSKN